MSTIRRHGRSAPSPSKPRATSRRLRRASARRERRSPPRRLEIQLPVLVAVGEKDVIGGSAEALAKLIPGARAYTIPGNDHNRAVGDRSFKTETLAFLAASNGVEFYGAPPLTDDRGSPNRKRPRSSTQYMSDRRRERRIPGLVRDTRRARPSTGSSCQIAGQ